MALLNSSRVGTSLSTTLKALSLTQVVAIIPLFIFLRWILRGIYRVYFHPLRNFPGPRFSAFTRIPQLKALWTGNIHTHTARLHAQYGKVVRISPDELSFVDSHAFRDINGHGSKQGAGLPPPKHFGRYGTAAGKGVPHLILLRSNAEHARIRKIFTPAFSDRALTQQAPLFVKYVDQLVGLLKDRAKKGEEVDMVRMYNFTTFDVMGDLTFGEPLHMLDNAEYDEWVSMIFAGIKGRAKMGVIYNFYPLAASILRPLLRKKTEKKGQAAFNHAATRVTKRLEKGRDSEGVDIWDLVLKQETIGKAGLTRAEMDSNASVFMAAGTETTATLLSGLTYLLLTHPESYKKLVEEIRGAFSASQDISMEAIQGLKYVNGCIKEALRVYPPVPVGLPHLTPQQGSTICGHYVPPGMTVSAPHYAIYRSPELFSQPEEFIPERWLGDERFAKDELSAVQPFSVGSRDCLGKNMAYHEMRLILTKVLYNFDLELLPEVGVWTTQKAWTLWNKTPLMVKLKAVGDA